jgi:hypothetical protein
MYQNNLNEGVEEESSKFPLDFLTEGIGLNRAFVSFHICEEH